MLYLINSNDAALLTKFSNLKWIYIGRHGGKKEAEKILSNEKRIFIARDIKIITESVRDNFLDYIGILSALQDNKVLWYAGSMASKSINETSLFNQYVYQKLLKKLSVSHKDLLVVTDDEEILTNTKNQRSGKIAVLSHSGFYKSRLHRRIRGYREVLVDIIFWFIYHFFKQKNIKGIDVFIHSWIDSRTFKSLPDFTDSYLADLGNFLVKNGHTVARLTGARLRLKEIFRLRKNFDNIVFPLSYLTFKDMIKSVFTRFAVSMNNKTSSSVQDYDILKLLTANEVLKENALKIYIGHLFLYHSYRNLALRVKGDTCFIYPFENQPWEKMLNLGFEKFSRIAYQHSTITRNSLNYCTSRFEDKEIVPQSILCAGKKWASFLGKYYPSSVIEVAGALRYSHLFACADKNIALCNSIIIALSIDEGVSIWLQRLLLNFLKRDALPDYIIKIKPHPLLPEKAYLRDEFADYKNCDYIKEEIGSLLKDACLVITSGSTVAFESVISGVKTLYVIPEEIALSHEDFLEEDIFVSYEENFSDRIKEALKSDRYPKVNVEDFFSKADYNIFSNHILQEFI